MLPKKYKFNTCLTLTNEATLECGIYGHIDFDERYHICDIQLKCEEHEKQKVIFFLEKYYNINYSIELILNIYKIFMALNIPEEERQNKINLLIIEN